MDELTKMRLKANKLLTRMKEIAGTTGILTKEIMIEGEGLASELRELKIRIEGRMLDKEFTEDSFGDDLPYDPATDLRNDPRDVDKHGEPILNRHESSREYKPFELRAPGEKKDYRSLFGEGDYQWRDKDTKFFEAVFGGRYHPDLVKRSMNEGVGSDGGWLIPVEYSEKIHAVSLENELVMPRAFVQPMTSNEVKIPGMEIGDHSSNLFGGFTASYKAEAATLSEANPKARLMTLQALKLTGFLRFSNELLSDTPNGESQIIDICGKGLGWYRDKAFLKGSGSGEPLGLMNANCVVEVDPEVGQTSGITYTNLTTMLSRLYAGSFQNSIFICHQSTIPSLLGLTIPCGTGGSHYPVLTEGKDGQFKMLTRPVIFTEKTETLNTKGDLMLCDFSQYVCGLRAGMRIDTSPHLYFATDETAARLIERHSGQPLWDEALTLQDGSTTVSPFVVLGTRS